ncbi:hypothetical protein FB451DRAFT_1180755 [Mycena latifolia]|nr:hypothetical protein FB451DRAFT_1180755 [Mycena latifolia]
MPSSPFLNQRTVGTKGSCLVAVETYVLTTAINPGDIRQWLLPPPPEGIKVMAATHGSRHSQPGKISVLYAALTSRPIGIGRHWPPPGLSAGLQPLESHQLPLDSVVFQWLRMAFR